MSHPQMSVYCTSLVGKQPMNMAQAASHTQSHMTHAIIATWAESPKQSNAAVSHHGFSKSLLASTHFSTAATRQLSAHKTPFGSCSKIPRAPRTWRIADVPYGRKAEPLDASPHSCATTLKRANPILGSQLSYRQHFSWLLYPARHRMAS